MLEDDTLEIQPCSSPYHNGFSFSCQSQSTRHSRWPVLGKKWPIKVHLQYPIDSRKMHYKYPLPPVHHVENGTLAPAARRAGFSPYQTLRGFTMEKRVFSTTSVWHLVGDFALTRLESVKQGRLLTMVWKLINKVQTRKWCESLANPRILWIREWTCKIAETTIQFLGGST